MESLIKHIDKFVTLSTASKDDLKKYLRVQHFSKKEKISEQEKFHSKLYFLQRGAIRRFHIRNRKEMTNWIYYPNMFFASWDSFFFQNKSDEVFEIISDVTLISIEHQQLQRLYKKHPTLEIWGRKLMEYCTVNYNRFNQHMRFASAQEKYDFYLKYFPTHPKLKLGHIASFLGITQETLSRLRKNLT